MKVHQFECILPQPFCSPWRHPIWWWKLRHLRADIEHHIVTSDAALCQRIRKMEDEAFLRGTSEL